MVKMPPEPPKHIAKEFKIGNTRVIISDDFCVKTPEEVDEILKRIARNALIAFQNAAMQTTTE